MRSCSPSPAVADNAELREYILELKGQYGESHEVELEVDEEAGPRKQRRYEEWVGCRVSVCVCYWWFTSRGL